MKSASTPDRTEEILYDIVGGSRSKPIAKLEYSQDQGASFTEFGDVKTLSFSKSNNNTQYNKFILVPPSSTLSSSFDNKAEKYSPGAGGEFDGILRRNLLVRPSLGYQMTDANETTNSFAVSNYKTLYHTKIFGSTIVNDIASASSFSGLLGITDNWALYDSETYDDSTYTPDGYWLSNISEYSDLNGSLKLTSLNMTSDNVNIYAYYRASDAQSELTNNSISFTSLGALAVGVNTLTLPDITERFFQFAIVFDTGSWGTGSVSAMSITQETYYEYFSAGEFLVDRPSFSSAFGNYSASISARDKFKKALETKVSSPSYTSSTDVALILRDACDSAGLSHNDGVELIPDTEYTVTIADDDNFKDIQAIKLFNEVMTYLNWKNANYRIELTDDGHVQLVIKDSTVNTADWQLDYRWNLLAISKAYESDNLAQRITVLAKSHTVETKTRLETQNYTSVQSGTTLSWSNDALYKEIIVTVNSGDGVFTLNTTENDSINFNITGTVIDVDVTVKGNELKASQPFIGESIYYTNAEFNDGITHKIINRLVQSDAECRDIAKAMTDRYGNPEWVVTAKLPYNPLLELGDRLLIFEKYTYTNTIYRIDNISPSYSADGASLYMSLKLTDLGSDFTNFQWDRNNVLNGGTQSGADDLKYDTGLLWDQSLFPANEDNTDYSYLKPVRFS